MPKSNKIICKKIYLKIKQFEKRLKHTTQSNYPKKQTNKQLKNKNKNKTQTKPNQKKSKTQRNNTCIASKVTQTEYLMCATYKNNTLLIDIPSN